MDRGYSGQGQGRAGPLSVGCGAQWVWSACGLQVVKMVHRKGGDFSGYAFAYFDTVENAENARALLYGLVMGEQQVDVKFSTKSLEELQ